MPVAYTDGRPLSDGYREWRVGYQNQSTVWRDSVAINGPAWGRDGAHFAYWRPDAQVKWFRTGYARPGERVCVDSLPPVMSLHWPYWYRAQSRTSVWSDISNPCGPFTDNDW